MVGAEAWWHWLVLGIVAIALFGYKKLPDASRSLGRSLRIFKTELKGLADDDAARRDNATPAAPAADGTATAVDAPSPRPRPNPAATPAEPSDRPPAS